MYYYSRGDGSRTSIPFISKVNSCSEKSKMCYPLLSVNVTLFLVRHFYTEFSNSEGGAMEVTVSSTGPSVRVFLTLMFHLWFVKRKVRKPFPSLLSSVHQPDHPTFSFGFLEPLRVCDFSCVPPIGLSLDGKTPLRHLPTTLRVFGESVPWD